MYTDYVSVLKATSCLTRDLLLQLGDRLQVFPFKVQACVSIAQFFGWG